MTSRFILPFADVGSGIKPSSGAKLFFYADDGVTLKDTYSDQLSTPTPNANPVIADSVGVFGDIFISGSYKVTLQDKNGSQIFGGVVVDEYAVGNFETNLINDLSQAYIFDTVADCTYVLLCCGPKPAREFNVRHQLPVLSPTTQVKLIYNSGYHPTRSI